MPISSRIRELREQRKISVRKFAADIGVSDVIVYRWQNREAVPNLATAIRIADYFSVSLDDLVGRAAPVNDNPQEIQRVASIEDFEEIGIHKGDTLTVEQVTPDKVTNGIYVIHANHPVLITLNEGVNQVVLTVNTRLSHILPSVNDLPQPLLKVKGVYHQIA
ncbi:MAG: helix-turn-helix domain-containing protein [Oxalobacter sp.]|nr:helix-turn-helix domain-containing protein [Oxalobacter sp.]